MLSDKARRKELLRWINIELTAHFEGGLLPVDAASAIAWGDLTGTARKKGVSLPVMDSLIAATAIANDLVLVTRNTTDIERCGAHIINPWLKNG